MSRPAPCILAIDTAGSACSVAVARGGVILAAERLPLRHGHGEVLLPMTERVTVAAGLSPTQFDAVAVAVGPGGFTGLRAGLAAAQGIALGLGARLVGISSFAAVAAAVAGSGQGAGQKLLVALDSRRDDIYVELFAADAMSSLAAPAAILPDRLADHIASHVGEAGLRIAGDATDVAADALNLRFRTEILPCSAPDARGVAVAALRQIGSGIAPSPVRPLYLRQPDVTLPRAAATR